MSELTFAEMRARSKQVQPHNAATAVAALTELARALPPQIMERFMDGESTDVDTRMIRRNNILIAQTLADMVIQIDRFADMNGIDLEAHIRRRLVATDK
jgi:hypothetical protein